MNRNRRWWLVVLVACMGSVTVVQAQRFVRRPFMPPQNNAPPTEFVFIRWHYGAGPWRPFSGGGWAHDYPTAEEHILQIMREASGLNVDRVSYRILELGSSEIFKYPFSYISEPGEMWLTDEEVLNMREYIDRGGFIMIDDFDGQADLNVLRKNLQRVFPDREMFRLPDDHPILHIFYDIDELNVISPYDVGAPAVFYGFPDKRGNICMLICYNNDVGDFWEWIDQPLYALKPSAESLRLGINLVMYALTH